MKKIFFCVFIQIVITGFAVPNLSEIYKNRTIKVIPSPGFGKGTDWGSLFFDISKELAVAENGNIFVSNGRQHNIFKFNTLGKHIGTYGRLGEGPGDLYYPGDLSIMDGRYLVIGGYGTKRRISVFDFLGKCMKVLKTDHSVYFPIALKKNKIAYIHNKYINTGNNLKPGKSKKTIFINDTVSGKEFPVLSREFVEKNFVMIGSIMYSITDNNESGDLFINRTLDGNLLVGSSNTPYIYIYSPEGKLLHSFRLQIKPIKVNEEYLKKFKDFFMADKRNERPAMNPNLIKKFKKLSFKDYFDTYLPLYREILVDGEGNILIFKTSDCFENCNEVFQVYSPEGKFICETTIDKGDYDFKIDRRCKNIVFMKNAIYGLFQLKDSEDISLRLVKVDLD
jgi:hypothetical protein